MIVYGIEFEFSEYLEFEHVGYICGDVFLVHKTVMNAIMQAKNRGDLYSLIKSMKWKFGPDLNAKDNYRIPMVTVGPQIDPDKITILILPWY